MPTIDEELGQLEKDVRQLKIEYEQYFGGGRARPPADIEWRIETVIKKYGERGANMKFVHRYRYSGLAQTYARYKEVFRKRLKQKEEGVVVRHYGAAARAIEAERAKHHEPEPVHAQASPSAATAQSKARAQSSAMQSGAGNPPARPDSGDRDTKSDKLYEAFRNAKRKAGEDTADLTPAAFQDFLKRKAQEILGKSGGKKVTFGISTEGGKVKLKARVVVPEKSKE